MIAHMERSVNRRDIGMGTCGPGLADRRCCIRQARDVGSFMISRPHPGTIISSDGSALFCAHKAGMTLGMHEAKGASYAGMHTFEI